MDFTTLELGENLAEENNQADRDAWQAEQIARMNKESMRKFGVRPISTVQLPRVAANPVKQEEYNARLYTLKHIIRNPELTEQKYPLADTWKEVYPHIPYNGKATNWKISKLDAATLKQLMQDEGVYKKFRMDSVASILARVKAHYLSEKVLKLERRVSVLELQLADNGNVWYRGIELVKLNKTFKVTLNGVVMETRHGTFDKLFKFLEQIDERLI